MADKPPAKDPEPTEDRITAPAEPVYAVEITMSHAELEQLRADLTSKFH